MKNKIKKIAILIIVISIISFQMVVFADAGSFESYSSGSSSSDSSGWSSSSSSSGGGSHYSSDSSDGEGVPLVIELILACGIFLIYILREDKLYKTYKPSVQNANHNKRQIDNTEFVEKQIKEVDEKFDANEFLNWTENVFIKLQEAWTQRDWSTIRVFETNELFEQHQKQLQGYIDNHQTNIMEEICVKNSDLYTFTQSGDKDILTVILNSKMIDYIIDDNTGKIIKGDKYTERHSTYKLVFIRKSGVKTQTEISTINCPNCGALTQINSSGKCQYCGSLLTTGEFNWVLSNLEKIG